MYKDKDKQREANRLAKQRQRAEHTADIERMKKEYDTKGMTSEGMTAEVEQGMTKSRRGKDIKCFADLPVDVQETINQMSLVDGRIDKTIKANRTAIAIHCQHLFPDRYEPQAAVCSGVVTGKPGDADYTGVCAPKWRAERGR